MLIKFEESSYVTMVSTYYSINKLCKQNGKVLKTILVEDNAFANPTLSNDTKNEITKTLFRLYEDNGKHGFSISNDNNKIQIARRSTLNTHDNQTHISSGSPFNLFARKDYLMLKSYASNPKPQKVTEAFITPITEYTSKNYQFSSLLEKAYKPFTAKREELTKDSMQILNVNKTITNLTNADKATDLLISVLEEKINCYFPERLRKVIYNFLTIEEGKIDAQYQEANLKDVSIVVKNIMENIHNAPMKLVKNPENLINLKICIPEFFNALERSPGPKVSNGIKYSWSDTSLAAITSQANDRGITIEKAIFEQIGIVKFFKLYYDIDLDTVDYGEINREILEAKCNWIFTDGPVWLQQGMHHFGGRYPLDRALRLLLYSQKSIEMEPERAAETDIFVGMEIIPFERNALIFQKDNIWIKTKQDTKEEIIVKRYPNKIILPIEEIEKEMPVERRKSLEIQWKKEIEE